MTWCIGTTVKVVVYKWWLSSIKCACKSLQWTSMHNSRTYSWSPASTRQHLPDSVFIRLLYAPALLSTMFSKSLQFELTISISSALENVEIHSYCLWQWSCNRSQMLSLKRIETHLPTQNMMTWPPEIPTLFCTQSSDDRGSHGTKHWTDCIVCEAFLMQCGWSSFKFQNDENAYSNWWDSMCLSNDRATTTTNSNNKKQVTTSCLCFLKTYISGVTFTTFGI